MSLSKRTRFIKAGGGGTPSLSILVDPETSINATYWSTAVTGTGTVTNDATRTELYQDDDAGGSTAKYYSKHSYKIGTIALRFRFKTTALVASSERFIGLALSDLSQYVCVHLSGAGTKEFACKDGAGSSVSAIADDLTAYHDFVITWAAGAAVLYVDEESVAQVTIAAHVPTADLVIMFASNKL